MNVRFGRKSIMRVAALAGALFALAGCVIAPYPPRYAYYHPYRPHYYYPYY